MKKEIFKILSLLIPRYKLNDLTTRRIALFALIIPFLFGGLVVWFSYFKVSLSEKKYAYIIPKLNETKRKLISLKTELDSSQQNIIASNERFKAINEENRIASLLLRDSLWNEKKNILQLKQSYAFAQKKYDMMLDSNHYQNALLLSNFERIESSSIELNRLNDSLAYLKQSLKQSKDSLLVAKADVELMKVSLNQAQGEASKIKPQSRSRTSFGRKDQQDRQLFEFTIWLLMPKEMKNSISDVTYKFNLPVDDGSGLVSNYQSITTTDVRGDFRASYTSWGCVSNMIIDVRFKNGVTTPIYFDLCKSLDNPMIDPIPEKSAK